MANPERFTRLHETLSPCSTLPSEYHMSCLTHVYPAVYWISHWIRFPGLRLFRIHGGRVKERIFSMKNESIRRERQII